ncbi:endonuclease domain-containing protein [Mesorhizobium sp. 1B3]|uniref:endonuclease domain-containing protein n=1 Tax=Mesorhizobium sp. 1B3 TaxID=3243599 RepID=UPI003D99E0B2
MRGPDKRATAFSRHLRRSDNDAEGALWTELRNRRLNGFKFVRQFPIGPYFADFACRQCQLVIEVDGSQQAESGHDRIRDDFMLSKDWSVLRIWNVDVLTAKQAILTTILAALEFRLEPEILAPDLRFLASATYRGKM